MSTTHLLDVNCLPTKCLLRVCRASATCLPHAYCMPITYLLMRNEQATHKYCWSWQYIKRYMSNSQGMPRVYRVHAQRANDTLIRWTAYAQNAHACMHSTSQPLTIASAHLAHAHRMSKCRCSWAISISLSLVELFTNISHQLLSASTVSACSSSCSTYTHTHGCMRVRTHIYTCKHMAGVHCNPFQRLRAAMGRKG